LNVAVYCVNISRLHADVMSGTTESSDAELPAAEASVRGVTKTSCTDDADVWTKPLPVSEEKSRFPFRFMYFQIAGL